MLNRTSLSIHPISKFSVSQLSSVTISVIVAVRLMSDVESISKLTSDVSPVSSLIGWRYESNSSSLNFTTWLWWLMTAASADE